VETGGTLHGEVNEGGRQLGTRSGSDRKYLPVPPRDSSGSVMPFCGGLYTCTTLAKTTAAIKIDERCHTNLRQQPALI
jgi:hypothetical protein